MYHFGYIILLVHFDYQNTMYHFRYIILYVSFCVYHFAGLSFFANVSFCVYHFVCIILCVSFWKFGFLLGECIILQHQDSQKCIILAKYHFGEQVLYIMYCTIAIFKSRTNRLNTAISNKLDFVKRCQKIVGENVPNLKIFVKDFCSPKNFAASRWNN